MRRRRQTQHPNTTFKDYLTKLNEKRQQREKKTLTEAAKAMQGKRAKLTGKVKQTKLNYLVIQQVSKAEQAKIDTMIMNYIISEARPLQTKTKRTPIS